MSAQTSETNGMPLVRMEHITRRFGTISALEDVTFEVGYQEIVGLLGDNGAGKSTLIKVLTGVHPPTSGQIYFEGQPVTTTTPQDARDLGIETVYQDLALVPLISISRNFYLGREPVEQIGPVQVLDKATMDRQTAEALNHIGIKIRAAAEPVGTLSGGERQSIAIGRAVHFGTKLLILDEPTSALSIGETRKVISYTLEAKKRGLSVIFITHNIHHVFEVADRFTLISHGHKVGDFRRDEVTQDEVAAMIMGEPIPERLRNRIPPPVPTRPIDLTSAPTSSADGTAVTPVKPMTAQQRVAARRRQALLLYLGTALLVALLIGAAYLYSRPQTTDSSGIPELVRTEYGNGFSFRLPQSWIVDRAESGNKHAQNAAKDFVMIMIWDSLFNKGLSSSMSLSQIAQKMENDDLFGRDYKPGKDITIGGIPGYRFEWTNNGSKRGGVDYIFIGTDSNFYDVTFDAPLATWEPELKPVADAIMASFQFDQ